MSYSDDTAASMFGGLRDEIVGRTSGFVTMRSVYEIIHNDGLSADEMMSLVAEYEKEWDSVLITERRDLAGAFKTAYMVELSGGGSDGERRSEPEPTPQSDARRSQRAGRLM